MSSFNTKDETETALLRFAAAVLHMWYRAGSEFGNGAFEAAQELARRRGEDPFQAGVEFTNLVAEYGRTAGAAMSAKHEEMERQRDVRRAETEKKDQLRRRLRNA